MASRAEILFGRPILPSGARSGADKVSCISLAATLPLELDYRQVTAYRVNLANGVPSVYVGIQQHPAGGTEMPILVRSVSASPFEAQGYRSGYQMVERVPMPAQLVARVESFIADHGHAAPCANSAAAARWAQIWASAWTASSPSVAT